MITTVLLPSGLLQTCITLVGSAGSGAVVTVLLFGWVKVPLQCTVPSAARTDVDRSAASTRTANPRDNNRCLHFIPVSSLPSVCVYQHHRISHAVFCCQGLYGSVPYSGHLVRCRARMITSVRSITSSALTSAAETAISSSVISPTRYCRSRIMS